MPRTISFQGLLIDPSGEPVPNGRHTVLIRLYDESFATLFSETHSVETMGGVFSIIIGSVQPLPSSLTFDHPYLIGLSIDGGAEMSPRTPLTAVPYAFYANMAQQARSALIADTARSAAIADSARSSAVAALARSLAPGATGAITSLNSASGDIVLKGGGGTTVNRNGDTITITSINGSSTGISGIQNLDNSLGVLAPNGPIATISVAEGGITTSKLADGSVTPSKIDQGGASPGNAIIYNGSSVRWGTPDARLLLPYEDSLATNADPFRLTTSRAGNAIVGRNMASGQVNGVYGVVTDTLAANAGVKGETSSPNGAGVRAQYSGSGTGTALELANGTIKVSGATRAVFTHTATVANKLSSNGTDIDNPLTNGDPNALLIVTQKVNPSGNIINASPIGVFYNTRNRWEIINENKNPVALGAQFNVLVIKQ
jgi:hypothetical protein